MGVAERRGRGRRDCEGMGDDSENRVCVGVGGSGDGVAGRFDCRSGQIKSGQQAVRRKMLQVWIVL